MQPRAQAHGQLAQATGIARPVLLNGGMPSNLCLWVVPSGSGETICGSVPIDPTQLVSGALGGAVVTATLGPLIGQRKDRRDLRAEVLRRLGHVEQMRWAPHNGSEFRESVVALRAAALVAGADREIVERYVFLAQVAHRVSEASYEQSGGDPEAGGIWGPLAELTRHSAAQLTDHLWHPYRKRLAVKRELKTSTALEVELRGKKKRIDWSPVRF